MAQLKIVPTPSASAASGSASLASSATCTMRGCEDVPPRRETILTSCPTSASSKAVCIPVGPAPMTSFGFRVMASLLQVRRELRQRRDVLAIVLDDEAGLGVLHDLLYPIHRGQRVRPFVVEPRYPPERAVLVRVVEVSREDHDARLLQLHRQHAVTWGVSGRLEDAHAAVAEHVEVAVDQLRLGGLAGAEGTRIDAERCRRRSGPGQLGPVDDPGRGAEGVGIAGVVEMEMRDREVGDVGRRNLDALQLVDQRLYDGELEAAEVDAGLVLSQLDAETGVPEKRPLRVADQVARNGQRARMAIVLAGVGEGAQVLHVDPAALDRIQTDILDWVGGQRRSRRDSDHQEQRGCEDLQGVSPRHRTAPGFGEAATARTLNAAN